MHTTTFSEMFPVDGNGYIIDTPGIKGFGTFDMEDEEILSGFIKQYYLDNAMVIVTTFKSLGTGADKTEFDCVINLEYFSSNITANQMSGRLRKEEGRKSYYWFTLLTIDSLVSKWQ